MTPKVAKCLLVSKVLVADGMMDEAEHEFLDTVMRKLGLDADERRAVIELEGWDEAEPIVTSLSVEERLEIIELMVDAASADGRLAPSELAAIKGVEKALGIKA